MHFQSCAFDASEPPLIWVGLLTSSQLSAGQCGSSPHEESTFGAKRHKNDLKI